MHRPRQVRRGLIIGGALWLAAGAAWGALTSAQLNRLPPPSVTPVVFARDIRPLLEARCVACHGRGRDKGGLRLDTRESLLQGGDSGAVVKPGKSGESLLIELVAGIDPDNVMPRKGQQLSAAEVGRLRAWIDQGLPWEDGVSFARPPARNLLPPEPAGVSASSTQNLVDRLLTPYLASNGIPAGAQVEDRVFARRLYLDLVGLLPPAEEAEAFAGREGADKRRRLARQVLADDEGYATHWLTFWNDLLRNDYRGTGYIDGGRKPISAWLYSALRTNLAFDRFVAELVNPSAGSEGYVKGIVWRGVVNSSQTPEMQAAQGISQVFLGVNIKCASCHDSLVNDWRLADAYGLAAVYHDGPLEMFQCDKPTGKTVAARFLYPEVGEIDPTADKPARLKRLAELMTGERNGRLSRTLVNRLWARLFGRGLVEPLDDMEQAPWSQELLDGLARDLVEHHYNVKQTLEVMVTSRAYQMPAVAAADSPAKDYVFRGPWARRMSAEQFQDAVGRLTGVWHPRSELPLATGPVRAALVPADALAGALGRPNREQVVTARESVATTLQALELTHGQALADWLHRGAERLVAAGPEPARLVDGLYRQALTRPPNEAEARLALALMGSPVNVEGVEDFLWAVAMLPEFQLIQ